MQSQPSIPVVSPVILIGTYRREQLEKWILPKGLYNYPISDDDKIPLDLLPAVKELWLFSGTKNQLVFDAEYLGVLDRSQLEDYPKGREKPHGNKYLLFRISQKYATTFDDAPVIVRANDFAHRSPAIRRQIMEALSSPDSAKRASVAKHLPSAIVSLPPERLRVCEAAVGQLSFWDLPGVQFSVTPIRGYVAKKVKGEPKPFVKWAGGKGQLLEQLDALLPSDFATRENLIYVEPFVGGGAMLFHVLSKYPNIKRAVINDTNTDLVTCYRVVKEQPEDLIIALHDLQTQYRTLQAEEKRKALFLSKRDRYNSRLTDDVETAALFIFLNRTCFNGLYRVNSRGEYNVPFGKAVNPLVCDEATIRADSEILKKVEVLCGDFERVSDAISSVAFFYFDPPYRPLTRTAAFTAYSKVGFDDEQQIRLANFTRRLAAEGNQWLLSNSDPHNVDERDDFFDKLFSGFDVRRVTAARMINSKADGRGKITELAIKNYEVR